MARVYLNKGISRNDLEKGVEFEVQEADQDSSDESFEDERFDEFINGKELLRSMAGLNITETPFKTLRPKMQPLTEDGLVSKQLLKWGSGIIIPDKSVVMMHYEAFLEKQRQPFDSTRLRDRPYKFLIGDGNILPGLEIGIKTMKKGEISRFLVGSEYAFGSMGCPPRIPENAEILYEVEILVFYESKDAIEFEEMTPEEQKKASFEKIAAVFRCENQMGNDLFRKNSFKPAIARYRRMVKLLEEVSVENEDDDQKRNGYLLKLYLNLSQCYINLKNAQKAIIYADLALKLDKNSPKGLYRMGYALHMTGDYDRAVHFLNKAKKHKPYEKSINTLMFQLEQKRKRYQEWEKVFYGKMFGYENPVEKMEAEMPETIEFQNAVENEIKRFVDSDDKELAFSEGYTENQIEVVKFFARAYRLAFVHKIQNNTKIIKVAKKHVQKSL